MVARASCLPIFHLRDPENGHNVRISFSEMSVAFSPDGQRVVSGSDDETVRLWDAVAGAVLQMLEGRWDAIASVAFLPDGKGEEALFVSNDWVVEGKGKILWLPPGYRATSMAVWNRIIVLGHSLGRISCLRFKEGSKFI
jgi:WD40 repeat protein